MKTIEEQDGNLVENISRRFLLSTPLASAYGVVIFINLNRLETTKKKLEGLLFQDFQSMISGVLEYWSNPNRNLEFDDDLSQDIRDLRNIVASSKEVLENYRKAVLDTLGSEIEDKCPMVVFRRILKKVLDIGGGLSNAKESRNIFVDLSEMTFELCVEIGWSGSLLLNFLNGLDSTCRFWHEAYPTIVKKRSLASFSRFMTGLIVCVKTLIDK